MPLLNTPSGTSDGSPEDLYTPDGDETHGEITRPLTNLTLQDIYDEEITPVIVNDSVSVAKLLNAVNENGEKAVVGSFSTCWGFDCEWEPETGTDHPVALLQLATHDSCFIVDVQEVFGRSLESDVQIELDKALSALFSNPSLLKVGYCGGGDLRKLFASFPAISAFESVSSVLDLSTLSHAVLPDVSRQSIGSLSRLAARCLGRSLDKAMQKSPWSQRPLTAAQIAYASLDAACLLPILASLRAATPLDSLDSFVAHYSKFVANWRFGAVGDEETARRLKAKPVYLESAGEVPPLWVVSQSWVALAVQGRALVQPRAPRIPTTLTGTGPFVDKSGALKVLARELRVGWVFAVSPDAADAPVLLGRAVANSKDKVLAALVPPDLCAEDAPPSVGPGASAESDGPIQGQAPGPAPGRRKDVSVEFNPRAGMVRCADADVLFVNIEKAPTRYPNRWGEAGRTLSFYVRADEWLDGTSEFASRLLAPGHIILLFAKNGPRKNSSYVLCGRCSIASSRGASTGFTELRLELLDFDAIKTWHEFAELVALQASTPTEAVDAPPAEPSTDVAGGSEIDLQLRIAARVNAGDVVSSPQLFAAVQLLVPCPPHA